MVMKKIVGLLCMGIGVLLLFATLVHSEIGDWMIPVHDEVRTVDLQGAETLNIEGGFTALRLLPERRKDIRVETETLVWQKTIGVRRSGTVLTLDIAPSLADVLSDRGRPLVVRFPVDGLSRLDVRLMSGNVILVSPSDRSHSTWDQVRFNIGTGHVQVENVHASQFRYQSSSGHLEAEGLRSNQATFQLASGHVELRRFSGGFDASISLGHMEAKIDQLIGPVRLEMRAGHGSIDLPDDADFHVEAKVGNGRVQSDLSHLNSVTREEKFFSGVSGHGKFPVRLNISSGNIQLR